MPVLIHEAAHPFGRQLLGFDEVLELGRIHHRREDEGDHAVTDDREANRDSVHMGEWTEHDVAHGESPLVYRLPQAREVRVRRERLAELVRGVHQGGAVRRREHELLPIVLGGEDALFGVVDSREIARGDAAEGGQRLERGDVAVDLRVHRGHDGAVAVYRTLAKDLPLMIDEQDAQQQGERDQRNDRSGDEEEKPRSQSHGRSNRYFRRRSRDCATRSGAA
jgi:hypothetical protein